MRVLVNHGIDVYRRPADSRRYWVAYRNRYKRRIYWPRNDHYRNHYRNRF